MAFLTDNQTFYNYILIIIVNKNGCLMFHLFYSSTNLRRLIIVGINYNLSYPKCNLIFNLISVIISA